MIFEKPYDVDQWINNNFGFEAKSKEQKALAVICFDRQISAWLAEHDPMALKQCQDALIGEKGLAG